MGLTFSGNWNNHVLAMEECCAGRGRMEITLSDDQERKLQNGGLVSLKERVSPSLAECLSVRPHWLSAPAALVVDATKSR